MSKTCFILLQELTKEEMVGPYVIWPAKAGMDFPKQEGQVTFEPGSHVTTLDIYLTPDLASSSPTPKRFQVELYSPSGGASVHSQFGRANVTLVSNAASQSMWGLLDPLHQPLNPTIINQVLEGLKSKFTSALSREQMTAVLETLGKVRGHSRNWVIINTVPSTHLSPQLFYTQSI